MSSILNGKAKELTVAMAKYKIKNIWEVVGSGLAAFLLVVVIITMIKAYLL